MISRALLFLFSHRLLAIARWEFQSLFVRFRNAIGLGNRGMARFVENRDKPTLLNLGSGPRGSVDSHWVNVDGVTYQNVHFLLDFNRVLPFTDESFQGVFCEHVLEHFTLAEGERLLRDVKRILSKQGVVRIVVPDGEHLVKMYCESPRELVTRRNGGTDTPMQVLNMYFRQRYEHQFIYDWETLHNTLKKVGFNTITRSSFRGCTHSTCLVLDDPQYAWESLYVEAQK